MHLKTLHFKDKKTIPTVEILQLSTFSYPEAESNVTGEIYDISN